MHGRDESALSNFELNSSRLLIGRSDVKNIRNNDRYLGTLVFDTLYFPRSYAVPARR